MNESGLNRFFGPLEAKVMDVLWHDCEMTIKEVQQVLAQEKPVSFNTVMTVMNRLVDKGMLQKRIAGRSSLFHPVLSRHEFLHSQSKQMTNELLDEFGAVVVNHMLDALDDADDALVAKLEQKIKELKKDM